MQRQTALHLPRPMGPRLPSAFWAFMPPAYMNFCFFSAGFRICSPASGNCQCVQLVGGPELVCQLSILSFFSAGFRICARQGRVSGAV